MDRWQTWVRDVPFVQLCQGAGSVGVEDEIASAISVGNRQHGLHGLIGDDDGRSTSRIPIARRIGNHYYLFNLASGVEPVNQLDVDGVPCLGGGWLSYSAVIQKSADQYRQRH